MLPPLSGGPICVFPDTGVPVAYEVTSSAQVCKHLADTAQGHLLGTSDWTWPEVIILASV